MNDDEFYDKIRAITQQMESYEQELYHRLRYQICKAAKNGQSFYNLKCSPVYYTGEYMVTFYIKNTKLKISKDKFKIMKKTHFDKFNWSSYDCENGHITISW